MPLTSTEYSRRRREKIKQENPEKYKQLIHEENQKYYKKIKEQNEIIEEIEYDEIEEYEIKEDINIFKIRSNSTQVNPYSTKQISPSNSRMPNYIIKKT
jgi:hypothetical protein